MKELLLPASLLLLGALAAPSVCAAHGGVYPPPPPPPPTAGGKPPGGSYGGPGDVVPPWTGPGAPGAGGPTSPGPGSPGGAKLPGAPATGPGGGAGAPGPASGAPSSGGSTSLSPTSWAYWWAYNRHPYLQLRSRVLEASVRTGGDELFLGRGQSSQIARDLRPTERRIRAQVVPALCEALASENSEEVLTASLVALARIGEDPKAAGGRSSADRIRGFVSHPNRIVAQTAVLSLGILGSQESAFLLGDLLDDGPRGRESLGGSQVSVRTRTLAACALGLVAERSGREDVRRYAVHRLVGAVEKPRGLRRREVEVACVTALGLSPLAPDPEPAAERWRGGRSPSRSLQGQVDWLLELLEDEEIDHVVRSHAATAIGRLLTDASLPAEWTERVVRKLLAAMGPRSKHEREIVQSCILALGGLADCDGDPLDRSVRAALSEAVGRGGDGSLRRFAMIALAQVAGRPGAEGRDPLAGLAPARKRLLQELARGRSTTRPWASLALGVLERSLLDSGRLASRDTAAALISALRGARAPEEVGALCVGLGLMRCVEATPVLGEKLEGLADDEARGFAALALGMIEARESIGPIREILRSSKYRPGLLREAAIGLARMGEKGTGAELVKMLASAGSLASQASIASALGFIGDSRSLDPLLAMLGDEELTARARAFAAVALGRVCDRFALPWNSSMSVGVNYLATTEALTNSERTGILDIL